jgi:hypothetical protein
MVTVLFGVGLDFIAVAVDVGMGWGGRRRCARGG